MVKKKASRNGKKNGKSDGRADSKSSDGGIWPLVGAAIVLLLIVTAILLLRAQHDEYPVVTTEAAALDAFRSQGVSEIIAPDLARDFASANYTLAQLDKRYPGYGDDIRAVDAALRSAASDVVAVVNGEPITNAELELQMSLLPDQYKQALGKDDVLKQMIDERLLLQEAAKRGIAVTAQEVDQAYQALLTRGALTEDELAKNLQTFGLDIADLRAMLLRQLTVDKLFTKAINETPVSDEEAQAFYDENKELFTTGPQVTVRHILIATTSNRSATQAHAAAAAVLARYENGEDFCDLVRELSDDTGSNETCGEYTFARGFMVPAFENASFDMQPGETSLVDTVFGTHVILKVADLPGGVQSFDDVKAAIETQLESAQRNAAYTAFITKLRDQADIVIPGQAANATAGGAMADAATGNDAAAGQGIQAEAPEATDNATEDLAEMATSAEPNAAAAPITVNVGVGEPEPTTVDGLAACLKTDGATLYTADWATASMDEAQKYAGEATILDCTGQDKAACDAANVDAFPTWFVGGAFHTGRLSEAQLAGFAGC